MRLAVRSTGSGERTAVLIHGIMSDSRAWHRVARDLRRRGFRVLAVDLTGHGRSPRARRYSPRRWADDVVETLERRLDGRPDLLVGHSLGALVASLIAERLRPRSVVYVDPAFAFPRGLRGVAFKAAFAVAPRPSRATLERLNPGWDAEDVELELDSLRAWDKRTILGFLDTRPLEPPRELVAPSLVVLAEKSLLITDAVATRMRERGMSVAVIPGSGHTVFRDDHAAFMRAIDRWIERHLAPTQARRTTIPA